MDTVFGFLFEFLGQFFGSLWSIITGLFTGIGEAFNFPAYVNIINGYTTELGGLAWGIAILAIVLLAAVLALIVWLIIVAVKKFIRSHRRRKDTESLVKEVQALNKEVMRLNLEKDKILSMKVSQIGLNPTRLPSLPAKKSNLSTTAKKIPRLTARASTSLPRSTISGRSMFRLSMTIQLHCLSSATASACLPAHSSVCITTSR